MYRGRSLWHDLLVETLRGLRALFFLFHSSLLPNLDTLHIRAKNHFWPINSSKIKETFELFNPKYWNARIFKIDFWRENSNTVFTGIIARAIIKIPMSEGGLNPSMGLNSSMGLKIPKSLF